MSIVIVKVLFVLQRIRFIIPAPSTSIAKQMLTCSQNMSQGSSSNIVWTWSTSLGVEHLQGAAPYGALEAALIDHEDWMEKSCQGGDL